MSNRPENNENSLLAGILLALEILRRMPRDRHVSSTELHQILTAQGIKCDLLIIQNILEMLSTHFDINESVQQDTQNTYFGYQWDVNADGFSFPMLSRKESLLLRLAEEHLRNLLPDSLKKAMGDSFRQARHNLSTAGYVIPENEWLSKVRVVSTTQALLPPTIQPGVFEAVSDALFDNYWLRMDYTNAQGKTKQIEVMPLGLAQQGARLYLVCRYSNGKGGVYNDERLLALNRMELPWDDSEELPVPLKFERPNFNLKQYDADGGFGFGEGKQIKLIFHIDQAAGYHLKESKLSEDQEVTDIGNNQYEISATVVETELLKSWLRGFGKQITYCKMTYCAIPL